jgi:hypothetical protein
VNLDDEAEEAWGKKVKVCVGSSGRRISYSLLVSYELYKKFETYCNRPSEVRIQSDSPPSPNGCQSTLEITT